MDLRSFLEAGASLDAAVGKPLRAERDRRKAAHDAAEETLSRYDAAMRLYASLRRCYAPPVIFGCTEHRWLPVAELDTGPGRRGPEIRSLECVVVPGMIATQTWHRPAGPPKGPGGAVTMTPTPVPPDDVAATAVALYASRVRLGSLEDVRREPCGLCGRPAILVCEHGFDYDAETQWVQVLRLCLACPRADIAASSPTIDAKAPHPLLPPAVRRP